MCRTICALGSLTDIPVWFLSGCLGVCLQNLSKQGRLTYGAVLEEVATRDENHMLCTHGCKLLPTGLPSSDGPPTTLSGTGVDWLTFLQANLTRDNTSFVNGTPVGTRAIFQVHPPRSLLAGSHAMAVALRSWAVVFEQPMPPSSDDRCRWTRLPRHDSTTVTLSSIPLQQSLL